MSLPPSFKMTTEAIQRRHPHVYESFYASHDLVISVPEILNRWYGACWRHDPKVRIQQKLPTRLYLWISPSAEPGIHFKDFFHYSFHHDAFEVQSFEECYQGKVGQRMMESFQYWLDQLDWFDGLNISVLWEFRRGNGSWYTTSLCLLYALFIHIIQSDLDPQRLKQSELLKVRELALKIDTAIYYPKTGTHEWWFSPYVSLVDSDFPLVYNGPCLFKKNKFLVDWRTLQNSSVDLKDIVSESELWYLWFEYVVLDGGGLYFSDHVRKRYESLFVYNEKPFLQTLFKELTNPKMNKSFVEVQEYHNQKSLYILMWYLHDQSEENLWKMLGAFRNQWSIYQSKQSWKDFNATLVSSFKDLAWSNQKIGVMPINCTDGQWRTFCIAKTGVLRKVLPSILEEVNQKLDIDARVVYSSRRDWSSYTWANIDQFLSSKKYSKYIRKWTVVYSDMQWNKSIMTMGQAMSLSEDGFLLDGVSKKIWYNGEKLTSKDLVSQSTTVEVMLMLFKHINKDISNKTLERSSYARNKNEMLSKVVLPFKKYVKKMTKEVLPLDCKGGLYDYIIRLGETTIPFHRVSRVGEGMSLSEED